MAKHATRVMHISVPKGLYEEIEESAREDGCTKSELIRDALREHRFNRRWRVIRRWGEATALDAGIQSEEDAERMAG